MDLDAGLGAAARLTYDLGGEPEAGRVARLHPVAYFELWQVQQLNRALHHFATTVLATARTGAVG